MKAIMALGFAASVIAFRFAIENIRQGDDWTAAVDVTLGMVSVMLLVSMIGRYRQ